MSTQPTSSSTHQPHQALHVISQAAGTRVAVVVVPDINKLLPWRGSSLTVGLERLILGLVLLCRVGLNRSWSG